MKINKHNHLVIFMSLIFIEFINFSIDEKKNEFILCLQNKHKFNLFI